MRVKPEFDGDRAIIALQRRLSLDPERVPEPPLRYDDNLPIEHLALRVFAVACIGAVVAWAIIAWPGAKLAETNVAQTDVVPAVAVQDMDQSPAANPVTSVKLVHVRASADAPEAIPPAVPAQTSVPPPEGAATVVATLEPPPAAEPAPSIWPQPNAVRAPESDRQISAPPQPDSAPSAAAKPPAPDAEQVAMLVKRGKDLLLTGDVVSARLLLRRAAEAGSADGALALGSTFDPLVIGRLGALGVQAEPAKAREWYQKAADLGSAVAPDQLAKLTKAGQ